LEFIQGLELNLRTVNKILQIAQQKGYLVNQELLLVCDRFRFDEINRIFEFHLKAIKKPIRLDIDKFIECYTFF
jgi:hypothetical protein